MEAAIDANTPLDCIEFDIFPSQNRYTAYVRYGSRKEKVTSGLLEHLGLHSAEIRVLSSKGSDAKFRLNPVGIANDNEWFTKSTLIRFLHIIGSENVLEVTTSLKTEISQLEEARRFHLSLYTKGTKSELQSGESGGGYKNGVDTTAKAENSDVSKNELLQAIDYRLTALRGKLSAAFDKAAGSRYSVGEMTDIVKFSQLIGSKSFSDSLHMCIELRQKPQDIENSTCNQFQQSDRVGSKEGEFCTDEMLSSEKPVRYGVSPAKVAQMERRSSSDDESSVSSEEEQPSAERSRSLARSASPRRSASPMRRVQIGRTGSRRATAITIKSLNFVPARDRSFFPRDADASDDDEGSRQAPKQSENNVRISVQDAISLFESKQRDQTTDVQKARSMMNASVGANKSVLRRWSSGVGENSSQYPQDAASEDSATEIRNEEENRKASSQSELKRDVMLEEYPAELHESDAKLNFPEEQEFSPVIVQEETLLAESTVANEKLNASAEWSRRKEAELSELLMKMMETKPVKGQTSAAPASNKRQSLPSDQRGASYNQYKEKRDERLRGEGARKGTEKDKQFKAMQTTLDSKKSQPASSKANDAGKKHNVKKMQRLQKSQAEPVNPKTEIAKVGVVKKASPKPASLSATRKSWPSMSSSRAPGPPPAKIPPATSHTGTIPARRRSQPAQPVSHASTKVEKSQPQNKSAKPLAGSDRKKSLVSASATEKKQQSVTKPQKTFKSCGQTDPPAPDNLAPARKTGFHSKVTKRSSVVPLESKPLESKPFLRKSPRTASNVNPAIKKKVSSSPQEQLRKSAELIQDEEKVKVSCSSDPVVVNEEKEIGDTPTAEECETSDRSPQKPEDNEGFGQEDWPADDGTDRVAQPELKAEDELGTISPTAWVEIEEHEDQPVTSGDQGSHQMVGLPAYGAPVGVASPRVRHSLSQMLLEESSEPDVIDWGNAENPPQVVYHKDAPKGFKRLLKFARKSKTDANSSGWSSPSVFSEGEDDSEDSKIVNRRSAENLLRKATLHSKNNGHQKYSDYEHSAQASIGNFDAQTLSQHIQEGQVSASVITTKASRSFFSLSAFKGSK